MDRKLRIAFLGNDIAWGGGAKSLLLMIKSISSLNLKLYLFVTRCSSEEMRMEFEKYVEFVKVINLPEIVCAQSESLKDNLSDIEINICLKDTESFALELNSLSIDILHINNSVFAPIYGIIKSKTRVIIISHIREWIHWNGLHIKQQYVINALKLYSDSIIAISNTESEPFKGHPDLNVVPNPFDFNELMKNDANPLTFKMKNGINNNWILVGMMSAFDETKGVLDFCRALLYLKRTKCDIRNLKFVLLGYSSLTLKRILKIIIKKILCRDSLSFKLLLLILKNRLTKDIIFFSLRNNVNEVIKCFDIAVRPSYRGDPWGRDIIEYMALGKPVVATGTSEFYIKNGETGYLIPPRDVPQLAEKIYQLYKDNDLRLKMGEKAVKIIKRYCDNNIFRQTILEIYSHHYFKIKTEL